MIFKKYLAIVLAFFPLLLSAQYKTAGADQLGWELAVHSVCFSKNTLEQAMDSIKATGITSFIAYRGAQQVETLKERMNYTIAQSKLSKLQKIIQRKGLSLKHFSVINVESKEEWKKLFEFANAMNVKMILSEPAYEHLPYIDTLAQAYKIKVGIHNHSVPSRYWHPQTAISYLKKYNLSKYIGLYPDTENWIRSGLDPIEMLKLAEGRIIAIQLKDRYKKPAPLGLGKIPVSGILHELKRQKFKGIISLEFFSSSEYKVAHIKKSADYFYEVANYLVSVPSK
ncbi:sugar phosphate isomerase/epimerase [Wenyingzhuangia heitensis]|uniref:Sugar phosphate isomerase/epimerase n=1 Tax=Wenyingzhuangia heitensis TaxID=1487859 RepID=A0ABX0UBK8_9FLAO|nr:sugar phosphate isomerase/epimerase [Wenyingzhuangia heitensis]NIJ44946.1 sugar phosphate isomerase/epimerase [Wenyingzhuangia heitensis]